MSIMGDIGSSILGTVTPAYLLIEDLRSKSAPGQSMGQAGLMAATSKAMTSGLNSIVGAVTSAKKTFRVQFNPSELQIYSSTPAYFKQNAQQSDSKQIDTHTTTNQRPHVELTVNLLFDDVNIYDSFMWDKFNTAISLNPTAIAKTAASVAMSLMGKKWTVQTEVEGIVSALRNPYTRYVTFQWADFSFEGLLTACNAKYTMFSTSGRPVRAQVAIRIRQEVEASKVYGWYSDFDKAFGGESSNLKRAGGGNLLNLNML